MESKLAGSKVGERSAVYYPKMWQKQDRKLIIFKVEERENSFLRPLKEAEVAR